MESKVSGIPRRIVEAYERYNLRPSDIANELGIRRQNFYTQTKGGGGISIKRISEITRAIAKLADADESEIYCYVVGCSDD